MGIVLDVGARQVTMESRASVSTAMCRLRPTIFLPPIWNAFRSNGRRSTAASTQAHGRAASLGLEPSSCRCPGDLVGSVKALLCDVREVWPGKTHRRGPFGGCPCPRRLTTSAEGNTSGSWGVLAYRRRLTRPGGSSAPWLGCRAGVAVSGARSSSRSRHAADLLLPPRSAALAPAGAPSIRLDPGSAPTSIASSSVRRRRAPSSNRRQGQQSLPLPIASIGVM